MRTERKKKVCNGLKDRAGSIRSERVGWAGVISIEEQTVRTWGAPGQRHFLAGRIRTQEKLQLG